MIPNGSTFRSVVAGSYGAFSGVGATSTITTLLNNQGITVNALQDDEPGMINQVLQGDWFSRPYQLTLDCTVTQDYQGPSHLEAVISAAVFQALNTAPSSVAVVTVNGIATGESAPPPPIYPTDGIGQGVGDVMGGVLQPLTSTVKTIAIVAIVGVVLLVAFAPKSLRALVAA